MQNYCKNGVYKYNFTRVQKACNKGEKKAHLGILFFEVQCKTVRFNPFR